MIETWEQTRLARWLCERIELAPTSHFVVIGNVDPNTHEIRGVVGYDGWNGAACEMHMAGSPGWITRELIWAAFDYPFNQAKCNVVIAKVPSGNTQALDIDRRLGFKTACILDGAHPDGALHILTMQKSDCRWLKGNPDG